MTVELVAGAVVAGRYRLDRLLGEGGMGIVWAATDTAAGRQVALKLLRPGVAESMAGRRRFLREARALAAIRHPSVVTVHDVVALDDDTPALVMDLLEGESVRDKLDREGTIALPELARILLPVVSAVGTAHARGIVHRDLKPDNIFLVSSTQAEGERVKVLDFGIAKLTAVAGDAAATTAITHTGALLGTPYYMSPEQILGEGDVDHRADIWAIGVILYECLTAVRPTEADSVGKVLKRILTGAIAPVREVMPDLPADVVEIIDRTLSFDRGRRPADLHEIGSILERYAAVSSRPFGPPVPTPAPSGEGLAVPTPRLVARRAADTQDAMLATLPAVGQSQARAGEESPEPKAADVHEPSTRPPESGPRTTGRRRWSAVVAVTLTCAGGTAVILLWQRPPVAAPPREPTTATTFATSPCAVEMAFVAGGSFAMGSDQGKGDERPVHRVAVEDFCLDRIEVTISMYNACVAEGRCRPPETTVTWEGIRDDVRQVESRSCYATNSDRQQHPMNCVSSPDADAYCRSRGQRLPSEEEWEFAARAGPEQRLYPWGAAPPDPTLLNACGPECAAYIEKLGGPAPPVLYPEPDRFPTTAPPGSSPAGDAAAGIHDLAGNVGEWTSSPYCTYPSHICASPFRVFRGGGWHTGFPTGVRATARLWSAPEHRYNDVGFRCAMAAVPSRP